MNASPNVLVTTIAAGSWKSISPGGHLDGPAQCRHTEVHTRAHRNPGEDIADLVAEMVWAQPFGSGKARAHGQARGVQEDSEGTHGPGC